MVYISLIAKEPEREFPRSSFFSFWPFSSSRKKSTLPFFFWSFWQAVGNRNLRFSRLTAFKNGGKFWAMNRDVNLQVLINCSCIYFVFRQCFKMSDVYVKIKGDKKKVKLKSSTVNNSNPLAMILRLDLNQGIYVCILRRRELDNSPIKYWLLPSRGLWEDVLRQRRTN